MAASPTELPAWDETSPVSPISPRPVSTSGADGLPSWDETAPVAAAAVAPDTRASAPMPTELPSWEETAPAPQEYKVPEEAKGGALTGAEKEGILTPAHIVSIASATGVDPVYIRRVAPWFSLIPEGEVGLGTMAQAGLGGVAGVLPIDIRDLYKKFGEDDPAKRKALDALMDLRVGQQSRLGDVAHLGASIVEGAATAGIATRAGAALGEAVGMAPKAAAWLGRALGVGESASLGALGAHDEHEAAGAVIGATLHVGLPAIVAGAGKVWGAATRKASDQLVADIAETVPVERVDAAYRAAAEAETTLSEMVTRYAGKKAPSAAQLEADLSPTQIKQLSSLYKKPQSVDADDLGPLDTAARDAAGVVAGEAAEAASVIRETQSLLGKAMGVGGARGSLADAIEREGPEFTAGRLEALRRSQYLVDELAQAPQSGALGKMNPLRRVFKFMADARYVYDAIDNRFGTELAPALDHLSAAYNASTVVTNSVLQKLKPVLRAIRGAEEETLSGASFRESVYKALDTGDFSAREYTPKQIEALGSFRKFFSEAADTAESLHELFPQLGLSPLKIHRKLAGEAQSYIPHSPVPLPEIVSRVRSRLEQYPDGSLLKAVATGDGEATATLKGLELYYGSKITSPSALRDATTKLAAGARSEDAVRSSARALFSRQGEIPDYLLNTDVVDLATKWVGSTYRHGFMRDGLGRMSSAADGLAEASPVLSQYIRDHVSDLLGSRRGDDLHKLGTFASWTQDQADRMRIRADAGIREATNPVTKGVWALIGGLPDAGRSMSGNVYSYYLGLRLDNVARNLSQLATMTVPSMHPKYAGDAARRAVAGYYNTGRSLFNGAAARELREAGLAPSTQLFEAQRELKDSLTRSGIGRGVQQATDAAAAFSMKMYETADLVSRHATLNLARDVVRDAMGSGRSREAAMAHLSNVSPGYLTAIRRAFGARDEAEVTRLYSNYLNGATQFNYNRVSMSEFGRAMGPMLSMFSKWPTAVFGELAGYADARTIGKPIAGDTGRVLWKYVAPLFLAGWAQDHWKEIQADSPALKALVGNDINRWFPSDVVHQLVDSTAKKEVPIAAMPPIAEASFRALKSFADQDPEGMLRALLDGAISGVPFSSYARFLAETLPEAVTGEPIVKLRGRELLPD